MELVPNVRMHRPNSRQTATIAGVILIVAIYFDPAFATTQIDDTVGARKHVVILNATDPYLPAFQALDSALRETIHADSRMPVEFYSESLDMHRFPRAQFEHELVALLRKKYADLKVDVVVADASIALDFALQHRTDIWPGSIIVFNSVPTDALQRWNLDSRTIGLPVQLEFGQTLDLALKLRPATRRLVVIAGAADPDRKNLSLANKSLERYVGKLRFSTSKVSGWHKRSRRCVS